MTDLIACYDYKLIIFFQNIIKIMYSIIIKQNMKMDMEYVHCTCSILGGNFARFEKQILQI